MIKLKRILSFITILTMLFAFPVLSEEATEIKYKEEISMLKNIGLLSDENQDFSGFCTRGEFARILTEILDKDQPYLGENIIFSDVPKESEYFVPVSYMYDLGAMSGHTDGTFRPSGNISYNEAISVMVKLLGYGVKASALGGYPYGFTSVANELRLSNGLQVSDNARLSYEEVYKLIYNSLFVAMAERVVFGDTIEYSPDSGKTLLNTYLEMDYTEGVLTDNSISSLTGKTSIKENAILVNNVIVENAKASTKEYLGHYVRVYYKVNKTDKVNEYVYMSEVENRNKVLIINAEDIAPSTTLTNITYVTSKKTYKTANVNSNAYYMKNGEAVGSLTASDIKIKAGALKLIDYDSDNSYDILFVDEFQTMVYRGGNRDKDVLFGLYDEKIDLSQTETIAVYGKDGEETDFDGIIPYDVIAVFKGANSAKIEICTYIVQGTLEAISDGFYIIGGEEYRIAPEYKNSTLKKPQVGESGEFYLGKNNMLAYFEEESAEKLGIAVDLSQPQGVFATDLPQIKIYTTDGKFEIFDFQDRIELNGTRIDSEEMYNKTELFSGSDFIRQPVVYELSEQGEIKLLQFPDSTKPDTDVLQAYSDTARDFRNYNPGTDAIYPLTDIPGDNNNSVYIGSKTWYFKLPSVVSEERFYSVSRGELPFSHNSIIPSAKVYFTSYNDKRYSVASIVTNTVAVSRTGDWNERQMVVSEVSQGLNSEGDVCQVLKGYVKGKEVTYYADDAVINGVTAGDVLQLTANVDTIARYRKVYSIEKDKTCTEWYDLHSGDGQLYDFYNISDPNSVNGMGYYINTELLASSSLFTHRTGAEKGAHYISGKVTGKNGNYLEVTCDNGDVLQLYLNSENGDYYSTFAYRYHKESGQMSTEAFDNIGLEERVALFTEAFSVIDIMVIE